MVRLLPFKPNKKVAVPFTFNPTMVRLLLRCQTTKERRGCLSIPQWCDCCPSTREPSKPSREPFNPTMVRLLLTGKGSGCGGSDFQSHNGAIAAAATHRVVVFLTNFQSHNGAIAARLLGLPTLRVSRFQSHNGAIAATAPQYIVAH